MNMNISFVLLGVVVVLNVYAEMCPKQCDCDRDGDLNRALCENQNIASIDIGVPRAVQVYSLSNNAIAELENFCFKELGYTNISILNVANNHIFWIGLHAFSGLDNLINLDLSYNRLRYVPSDLFWDTPFLTYLDLSGNIFESLKNEPFLMHTNLKVLNLNNCRMKFLPDRLFTRLPHLTKLDLSENYMVSISIAVLSPMRNLATLRLRNEYWRCEKHFMAVESWIVSNGIEYDKQCRKLPKMSEKIINDVAEQSREEVNLDDIWNVTVINNVTVAPTEKTLTGFERLNKEFPSYQAFILGLEIGLAIGILGTYLWLRSLCKCGVLKCRRPQTRREQRRAQRIADTDMRENLLWTSLISPDPETPPLYRRQISLPDRAPPFPTFGLPSIRDASEQISETNRGETPPPPYNECRFNLY